MRTSMCLISPHKKQYKANLHSHSTFSDGKRTPLEQKEKYKKVGSQKPREYSVEYINEFIKTANENGYLAAYKSSMVTLGE